MTALAFISGNMTEIKKRSLLNGSEGYISMIIKTESPFRTPSYIWSLLKGFLPQNLIDQIRSMRPLKNMDGAVFDVPEKYEKETNEAWEEKKKKYPRTNFSFEKLTALPDLKEFEPLGQGFSKGSYFNQDKSRSQERRRYGYNKLRRMSKSKSQSRERSRSRERRNYKDYKNRCSIFIGGLRTEEEVMDFLEDNKIKSFRINTLKDSEGNSKNVSFVDIDPNQKDQILKLNNSKFEGKYLRINEADSKSKK